jgi:hypothetical protein
MSKSKKVTTSANEVALGNSTTSNLAYHYAKTNDTGLDIAAELYARYPQGLTDEAKVDIKAGFLLRHAERAKPVQYLKEGADTYTKIDRPLKDGEVGLLMTVELATGYTTHDFGKLKAETPNYHGLIKATRDASGKYESNKFKRLEADIAYLMANGGARPRNPNKAWSEAAAKLVEALIGKAIKSRAKGDDTAPSNKAEFRAEVIAIIDAMSWK